MSLHIVIGSGPVGAATARLLAARGEQVRVLTRRGTGPDTAGIEHVAVDAKDATALREATSGAAVIYNCAAPPYWNWPAEFPPLAASVLAAAEFTGAVLAIAGNLYGYAPPNGPLVEELPLTATTKKGRVRAQMWLDALASHQAGRVRVTEARASDYLGAGAVSYLTESVLKPLAAGKRAIVPAALDAPHSWTYTGDVARTLIAVADDERGWGRAWHVPSEPAISVRDIAIRAATLAGVRSPRLTAVSERVLSLSAAFASVRGDEAKMLRALGEVGYQRRHPWVLDSSDATETFGLKPTGLDDSLRETMRSYIQSPSSSA
ncbi:NAD-dependent epimerase/dehydratase family protein [Streptomyces sp. NPDC051940]|uniref:NAD-dependent epimerase/dehydratase family protein n=1 Tax=Streptomyces sp. NPDC051940 TaxID=3155675 RepID=UPI003415D591